MKSCGKCSACCIAPRIDSIPKPAWTRCENLERETPAGSCRAYASRPDECRAFSCVWKSTPDMPKHFRPDRSGLMLVARPGRTIEAWEVGGTWAGSPLEAFCRPRLHGFHVATVKKAGG